MPLMGTSASGGSCGHSTKQHYQEDNATRRASTRGQRESTHTQSEDGMTQKAKPDNTQREERTHPSLRPARHEGKAAATRKEKRWRGPWTTSRPDTGSQKARTIANEPHAKAEGPAMPHQPTMHRGRSQSIHTSSCREGKGRGCNFPGADRCCGGR